MLRAATALVAVVVLVSAGCGGDGGRDEAVDTAETWLRAVGDRDADRACALMGKSATDALRKRSGMNPRATCAGVIRAYSDGFERGDIDDVLRVGLEAEGTVKEDELGVFPRSGTRELQVILMRRSDDEWKVASTTLGPAAPRATATPAG